MRNKNDQNFKPICLTIIILLSLTKLHLTHGGTVEIKKIPNTGLFTGQFYTIDNQGGNQGRLTYSYTKIQKDTDVKDRYQHLQIAFGSEMQNYVPGGKFWDDAQFIFIKSDKEGYYTMVMKSNPTHAISLAGESPRGKYGVKDPEKDSYKLPRYAPGGKYHDLVLWKFVAEKDKPNTYGIYSSKFPKNGILTWTNGPSDDKPPKDRSWVEVLKDGTPEHSNGYLWKITPVVDHLDAFVKDVQTSDAANADLEARARRQFLIRDAEIINPSKDAETKTFISTKTYLLYSYNFTIDDDMSIFETVKFYIKPTQDSPSIIINPTKPEKDTVYSESEEMNLKISRNLILDPGSCVKWNAGYMRVDNKEINIPITFELAAYAYGDGIKDPERTIEKNVKYSGETSADYIATTDFKGKFIKQGYTSPTYSVQGKMSGDTALKTFMTARNVECSPDNY